MKKDKSSKTVVPALTPLDLHDFVFGGWQPPRGRSFNHFHIARIENYKTEIQLPVLPHRRNVHHFLYITKGSITRSKMLTQYEVQSDQLFFMPMDTSNSMESISSDAEGFYCHFTSDIFHHPNININLQADYPFFQPIAHPIIDINDSSSFLPLIQLLEKEYYRDPMTKAPFIGLILLALLTHIKLYMDDSIQGGSSINAAAILTQKFKKALSKFIDQKMKVNEYAEHLSVTPNHLNKSVKATTGKSAHQLIGEMRILEAKVLLAQTSLSIKEIAYKIGKMDQSDFTRFFKSKTTMTPNQYRKNIHDQMKNS